MTYVLCTGLAALFLCAVFKLRAGNKAPLPPGPPKLPLLGNIFNGRPEGRAAWEVYYEWAKQYDSDIIHLNMAGTSMIIVNSYEAALELFERRGATYNSRPRLTMLGLIGWARNIIALPYGQPWRDQRKMMHRSFHEQAAHRYRPATLDALYRLLQSLVDSPGDFKSHIQLMVVSIILPVIYGTSVKSMQDPHVVLMEKAIDDLNQITTPGRPYLVDIIPVLKYIPSWFPGAEFKRKARVWKASAEHMMSTLLGDAERHFAAGTIQPSLVATELAHMSTEPQKASGEVEEYDTLKILAAAIYSAGTDTSVSSLLSFILAMLLHPSAQHKAQEELDRVLAPGTLPTWDDQHSLPYTSALIKEVERWHAVVPVAVPHLVDAEDVYQGYRIPKGSIVIGNVWAMLHDEKDYGPDTDAFVPERYLTPDGKALNPDVRDPSTVSFGFGRRICPGRHHATSVLWITMASILTLFDISPCEGDIPQAKFEQTLVSPPKPFKCDMQPRSSRAVATIRSLALDGSEPSAWQNSVKGVNN